MDDAGAVCNLQRPAGLLEHVEGMTQREPSDTAEHRVERLAVDQFHHQVCQRLARGVAGLAVVVDPGDAGVVELRGGAGLESEALEKFRILGELGLEDLDGYLAVEAVVHCLPHLAHSARRDEPQQSVALSNDCTITQWHLLVTSPAIQQR